MNIPLVSEYKIPFILHRVSQTFFGGFELSPVKCSPQWCLKLILYLLPSLLGVLSVLLIDNQLIDQYIGVLTLSMINLLFVFSMHLTASTQRDSAKVSPDLGASECKSDLQLLIPLSVQHSPLTMLIYSLMASSLIGLMSLSFRPNLLTRCWPQILVAPIFVLGWASFTVAHHSLTMGPPPETAAYSMTFTKADSFNRPVHLLVCLGLMSLMPDHLCLHQVLSIVVALLPELWLLGVVPPVQSLVHHLLEQINTLLLGGTGSSCLASLLVTVVLCLGSTMLAHFFIAEQQFLLTCALVGFLASNKWMSNWDQLRSLFHLIKTLLILAVIIISFYLPASVLHSSDEALSISLVGLLIFTVTTKYSHRVYIANLVKNPLNIFAPLELLRTLQVNQVWIAFVRISLHFVMPVVALLLVKNGTLNADLTERLGQTSPKAIIVNVLTFRLFRMLWQSPLTLSAQLVAIPMLDAFLVNQCTTKWPLEVKLFVLSVVLGLCTDFMHKLYLVLVILWASAFLKKQRLAFSWFLFALNIAIMPLNLLVVVISCVLKAPVMPLFTLPIYLLTFPRPLQFWSTTPSRILTTTNDAAYYQQLMPRLIQSLRDQRIFFDFCKAGEFLLARYEDRLMWVQVLEAGYNYTVIQMKGLELQETSCHAIEASAIDHIIEMAFGDERKSYFNSHFVYAFTPLTRVSVKTYSDAKNVLTGIIDSPETYVRIKAIICQVLMWVILQRRIHALQEEKCTVESKAPNSAATKSLASAKSKNAVADIEANSAPSFTYESLQPRLQWSNASYEYAKIKCPNQSHLNYSMEWFEVALKEHTKDRCHLNLNELQSLNLTYRNIVNICFYILFPPTYTEVPTSHSICLNFNGEIVSQDAERHFFETSPDLYDVCIKSFQYSTKIAFDQVIFANETLSIGEMVTILLDFDQNWHFGNKSLPEWRDAVIAEKGNLFTIGKDVVKENFTSHLLSLQSMEICICSLNRSTIEAIWSSLGLELFYFSNDDEERYSIQAHPIILRNLTVQAADPPLGYPIFASEPAIINHVVYR